MSGQETRTKPIVRKRSNWNGAIIAFVYDAETKIFFNDKNHHCGEINIQLDWMPRPHVRVL